MINFLNKQDCSGCSACVQACAQKCLKMVADEEGFLYPQLVQPSLCTNCHLCEKVCPITNRTEKDGVPTAYAVLNRDDATRAQSSSGGVFYLLAQTVLSQGGVVFGAKYNEDFSVSHGYAENLQDVRAFMGSKYTQSEIGDAYARAKSFLQEGRLVLFTGTPCQIGGLKAYLRKDYDNLICQDIICHGVPSPLVWKKYVDFREAKAASKTRRTFSRHKKYGWKMYSVQFEFSNCTEYIQVHFADLYMRSFLRNFTLRPSCYHCSFKQVAREADITLADFWGIQKVAPDMDDDKGTSLVIVHSQKGQQLFEALAPNSRVKQVDFQKATSSNPAMTKSSPKNPQREAFMEEIQDKPFQKVAKKYCKETVREVAKRKLRPLYRKIMRRKG